MWALGVIAFVLLCGCLPFDDDPSQILSPQVARKFQLRFPSWAAGLSENARDFLRRLLDTNPSSRTTARQALAHPWLSSDERSGGASARAALMSPRHIASAPKTPKQALVPPSGDGGAGATDGTAASIAASLRAQRDAAIHEQPEEPAYGAAFGGGGARAGGPPAGRMTRSNSDQPGAEIRRKRSL